MDKIVLRHVTQTANYGLFVMHDQNRAIVGPDGFKPRKDLLESMKKDGFLETGHIVCVLCDDGKLRIIEGHNRFITAKFLGIPVWYSAHLQNDAATPINHSKSIKTWGSKDFAKGYAQDTADYAEVMAYHRRTGIPVMACFSLFANQIASSSGNVNAPMKEGRFKIKTRDLPFEIGKIVEAIGKHCDFATNINLVNAISRAMFAEGFDPARMIFRIERKPELLQRLRSVAEYESMLEQIYNHGVKGERLYLQAEIEKAMRKRNAAKHHTGNKRGTA